MTCQRCRSLLIRQYGEVQCLACGWAPPVRTPEQEAELRRELVAGDGKSRRREPSYMGMLL